MKSIYKVGIVNKYAFQLTYIVAPFEFLRFMFLSKTYTYLYKL